MTLTGNPPIPTPAPSIRARLRHGLVPTTTSERHAIVALVAGFVLEAATEVYQFVSTVRSVNSTAFGYYLSLATTLVGFYLLWRGLHEWNRLLPRPARRAGSGGLPWTTLALLLGGVAAVAAVNVALGSVGAGDTPAPLAWVVGGVMVLAFGSFFLSLRGMVSPLQSAPARTVGWVAFGWSLVVSTFAGLALGQVIVGLFVDFFTSWPALILALAPFIFATAPLFVTFSLLAVAYAAAYPQAARRGRSPARLLAQRRPPPSSDKSRGDGPGSADPH